MNNPAFDTLEYSETLTKAGVPEKQAKAQAVALSHAMQSNLATKEGLHDVKTELNHKIDDVKTELNHKIDDVKTELNHKIDMVDQKIDMVEKTLTIRLGGMITIATGIIIGAMAHFSG